MASADLTAALQHKEKEAADLHRDLRQSAAQGQQLVEENERLKQLLLQQQSGHNRAAAEEDRPRSRSHGSVFEPLKEEQDRVAPKSRSETAVWANEQEQRELEEKHRELESVHTLLQQQLEDERKARQAAEAAEARAQQNLDFQSRRGSYKTETLSVAPEDLQEVEKRVADNLRQDHQEQLDDLLRKREASQADAAKLRAQVQEQSQKLGKAHDEVAGLSRELREKSRQLAAKERSEEERQQAAELERLKETTRKMRKSVTSLRRQASSVSNLPPPELRDPQDMAFRGSLLEEVQAPTIDADIEELQHENEELLSEVDALRAQLEEMQARNEDLEANERLKHLKGAPEATHGMPTAAASGSGGAPNIDQDKEQHPMLAAAAAPCVEATHDMPTAAASGSGDAPNADQDKEQHPVLGAAAGPCTQVTPVASSGSGGAPKTDEEKAMMVIKALQDQLKNARNEVLEANERLKHIKGAPEAPSFWQKVMGNLAGVLCANERAKPVNERELAQARQAQRDVVIAVDAAP